MDLGINLGIFDCILEWILADPGSQHAFAQQGLCKEAAEIDLRASKLAQACQCANFVGGRDARHWPVGGVIERGRQMKYVLGRFPSNPRIPASGIRQIAVPQCTARAWAQQNEKHLPYNEECSDACT